MNVVLGVEHAGDHARAIRERRVQRLGLALGPAAVDDDRDALWVAVGYAFRYLPGPRIIGADDDEQLEGRMITADQSGERGSKHRLLVSSGNDQRERVGRLAAVSLETALVRWSPGFARHKASR